MTTEVLEELDADEGAVRLDLHERHRRQSAAAAVAALREEAARLKRRELEEAFEKLEAHAAPGGLADAERDALEEMADAIVEGLLAAPVGHLGRPARPSTSRTALRLFDLEREPSDRRPPIAAGPLPEVADGE